MDPLRLPVCDRIVAFELPPDRLVLMARYLTAAIGKDRRRGRFIRNPRAYALGVMARRLDDLAERGGEAIEEMQDQMSIWLRCAEHDAPPDEPPVELIVDFMIHGPTPAPGDGQAEILTSEFHDMRQACRAVIGHRPEGSPSCDACGAARQRHWSEVLDLTDTPPQLIRELYRNFLAVGYPAVPPQPSDSF